MATCSLCSATRIWGSYIISHVQPIEVEVRKVSASELTDAYAI